MTWIACAYQRERTNQASVSGRRTPWLAAMDRNVIASLEAT